MRYTVPLAIIIGTIILAGISQAVTYPVVKLSSGVATPSFDWSSDIINNATQANQNISIVNSTVPTNYGHLDYGSWINQTNTTYMAYQYWNSTNATYDTLTRTAMLYSAWNATNETYMRYDTWNATNATYPAINATGWLNEFGYNGSEGMLDNLTMKNRLILSPTDTYALTFAGDMDTGISRGGVANFLQFILGGGTVMQMSTGGISFLQPVSLYGISTANASDAVWNTYKRKSTSFPTFGQELLSVKATTWNGTGEVAQPGNLIKSAELVAVADEDQSHLARGSKWEVRTTTNGTYNATTKWTFGSDGTLMSGTNGTQPYDIKTTGTGTFGSTNQVVLGGGTYAINATGIIKASVQVDTPYIGKSDGSSIISMEDGTMFATDIGYTSIDWTNRYLYASDGSTVMLDWSTDGTVDLGDNALTTAGTGTFGQVIAPMINATSISTNYINFSSTNYPINQTNTTYALNTTLATMAWNQTNATYDALLRTAMLYSAWNATNESYVTWMRWNVTNESYVVWDRWNVTNSTYDALLRNAMLYSAWNSTNSTYDALLKTAMLYSTWNTTNASYALNTSLASMAWNQTNASYVTWTSLNMTNATYPAINATGWLNEFGYNGTIVQTQNLSGTGSILFAGTSGSTPASGAGTRMMWIPAKSAFRAGEVSGTQWDDASIGLQSFAAGQDAKASGQRSFATGAYTTASGYASTVIGIGGTADYYFSTSLGYYSYATGSGATAIGYQLRAYGKGSTAIGYNERADAQGFVAGTGVRNAENGQIAMGFCSTGNTLKSEGNGSIAMGQDVNALTNPNILVFGKGFSTTTAKSFNIGFDNLNYQFTDSLANFTNVTLVTSGNYTFFNGWTIQNATGNLTFWNSTKPTMCLDWATGTLWVEGCSRKV